MRTSHLMIRKRILEEKSKITDEQFFASREYGGYLTDITESATKRYNRAVRVYVKAGVSGNFSLQMHTLNSLYNDEFDFYIYHNNSFMTLDEWIREADLTHPFFVGRTFDYHY